MPRDLLTPKARNLLAPKQSKTADKLRQTPTVKQEPYLPYLGAHTSQIESKLAAALDRRKIAYVTQQSEGGGRNMAGGTVVDFVLYQHGVYIRVQGDYWHGTVEAKAKDDLQKVMLQANAKMRGDSIIVVDIWEHEINRDADAALMQHVGVLL